jgi:hypothetical protein
VVAIELLRDVVYGECGLWLANVVVEFVNDVIGAVFEGLEEDLSAMNLQLKKVATSVVDRGKG